MDQRYAFRPDFSFFPGGRAGVMRIAVGMVCSSLSAGGEGFLQLVLEENVLRLLGKMSYSSHENPAYYNVITVVAGYAPYTLLVLLSLFFLKYHKVSGKLSGWWYCSATYIREMDDVRLFSLLSIVLIFVFYCIPKSKRSVYLLPIYPFLAYFLQSTCSI